MPGAFCVGSVCRWRDAAPGDYIQRHGDIFLRPYAERALPAITALWNGMVEKVDCFPGDTPAADRGTGGGDVRRANGDCGRF